MVPEDGQKKVNLDPLSLRLYIKVNSEWIMDLNVKNTTMKLLGKNMGETL